jgi:Protein of unknown function (DUF3182)
MSRRTGKDLLRTTPKDEMTKVGLAPAVRKTSRSKTGKSSERPTSVVFYRCDPNANANDHDLRTKAEVARSLAALLGIAFAGEFDASQRLAGPLYVVPSDTLHSLKDAARLGIHTASDLFGGVVPFPFVATKVITHPLVSHDSAAPAGWTHSYGERVRQVVLPGYSAFTPADAKLAGLKLLEQGAVRMKDAGGVGGAGQSVVSSRDDLDARVDSIDPETLSRDGIVLERNLTKVATHSIGQIQVGTRLASYFGTQRMTANHRGHQVYGGSSLVMVRGGFEELLRLDHPADVRIAVEQALKYHREALLGFAGMFVSRCNYDVAQGVDDAGQWRSGVLEQSWRIGGASGAEIAALHAFKADPELPAVRASSYEVYSDDPAIPPGAIVYFDGVDPQVGRLAKYVQVEPYADT